MQSLNTLNTSSLNLWVSAALQRMFWELQPRAHCIRITAVDIKKELR